MKIRDFTHHLRLVVHKIEAHAQLMVYVSSIKFKVVLLVIMQGQHNLLCEGKPHYKGHRKLTVVIKDCDERAATNQDVSIGRCQGDQNPLIWLNDIVSENCQERGAHLADSRRKGEHLRCTHIVLANCMTNNRHTICSSAHVFMFHLRVAESSEALIVTWANPGKPEGTISTQSSPSSKLRTFGEFPSLKKRLIGSITWATAVSAVALKDQSIKVIPNTRSSMNS